MFRRDSNRNRSQAGSRSSSAAEKNRAASRPIGAGSGAGDFSGDPPRKGGKARKARKGRGGDSTSFVLYVEGPRDRDILSSWARRLDPGLARLVDDETVILGGRQPVRARDDFRKRTKSKKSQGKRFATPSLHGLIVLDRDHHTEADAAEAEALIAEEAGLELFVWGRRHIESYLLVPETLRRVLRVDEGDDRIERALRDSQETTEHEDASPLDAKRLLGTGGSLSEAFGVELRASEIARAMRVDELHDDVRALFGQIGRLSGIIDEGPEVVIRTPRP